jgi:cytochrome P450
MARAITAADSVDIAGGDKKGKAKVAPGPRGCVLFGSLSEMREDSIKLLMDAARDFGDVVRLRLVQNVHLINYPDGIKHVLQDRHTNYQKGFMYERMKPLVGEGLLTSEGDFWKRQRRLAQPAFHKQRIVGFAALMARHTTAMLDRWEPVAAGGTAATLDCHGEMMKLTFAIVGDALFSMDVLGEAEDVGRALTTALEVTNHRFQSLFVTPKKLPTPENRRFDSAMKVLEKSVRGIIAARRGGEAAAREDLLAMLMAARDEETGEGMDDQQLRDEVMTMILAGHETTANALSWAFYLLSRNPAVERKLRDEVGAVLGGRPPTIEDLGRLKYTQQVIDESMRLYPPAWLIARKALEADEIGGYEIPKGSTVLLCPYTMHRHVGFWENPEAFDPERFAPELVAARPRFAYYPFAAGPRMCIGNAFAAMEMQIILAMVTQRYHLSLQPGFKVEEAPQVTLRPKNGVLMHLRAAPPAAARTATAVS